MGTIGYRLTIGKTYQSQYSWILPYSLIKVKSNNTLQELRGLQNKFDYYSSPEYNILVGYDKGIQMESLFTVVFLTELEETYTFTDLTVTEVTGLVEKFLDDTVVETKITLQD